jgi:S-phase kinase-associated protein 1
MSNLSLDEKASEQVLGLDSDESVQKIINIRAKSEDDQNPNKYPYHKISRKALCLSTIIDAAFQGDSEETEYEFDLKPDMMELIIEWLTKHDGKAPEPVKKPIRSKNISEIVSDPWDATFLSKLPKAQLYELTKAANFLDIKPLLDICAAKIASIIKGVPLEKAEEALDPNTPEPEEQKTN